MTGRSAQVARGLNTIAANIVANDSALAKYNVSVKDSNGNLKSTYDVLRELKPAWDEMSQAERVALGQTLAGKNQYKVLASVMQNFAHAVDATETAMYSFGSAEEENSKAMESWALTVNNLKAAWQRFSTAVIDSEAVKNAVKGLTDLTNKMAESKIATTAFTVEIETLLGVSGLGILGNILPALSGGIANLAKGLASFAKGGAKAGIGILNDVVEMFGAGPLGAAKTGSWLEAAGLSTAGEFAAVGVAATGATAAMMGVAKAGEQIAYSMFPMLKIQDEMNMAMDTATEVWDTSGGMITEYSDKATEAMQNLLESTDLSSFTSEQQQEMQSYVNRWQDLIKAVDDTEGAYDKLSPSQKDVYDTVKKVSGALDSLEKETNKVSQAEQDLIDYQKVVDASFNDVNEIAQQATEGLAKYQEALSNITDFAAPLQSYQEAFKSVQEQFEAGTLDYFEMKAAVDLFLPPETLSNLGYDVQEAFAMIMDGTASSILTASNPLAAFNNLLLDTANAGNAAGFSIREMDGQLASDITNWDLAAKSLNMPVEMLKAIVSYAQSTSDQLVIMTADLIDLAGSLDSTNFASMQDALVGIGTALRESDPSIVQEYVSALQEAGMIEIEDIKMDVDYSAVEEALSKFQDLPEGESKENTMDVDYSSAEAAVAAWDAIPDGQTKTNYMNIITSGGEQAAEGTDNAKGGPTLVNEEGPEIIQSGSKAYIAGGGMPTITNLNKGDMVFTADETKDILNNGGSVYNKLIAGGIGSRRQAIDAGVSAGISKNLALYSLNPAPLTSTGQREEQLKARKQLQLNERNVIITGSGGGNRNGGSGGGPSVPAPTGVAALSDKEAKEEFETWLKAKKHALAMDEITEQEYYDDLEKMYKEYFEGREELQDEYWKYEEQVYKYRKQQQEDEIDREEKLNELAKAKTQKVLVYKDGMFQYVQNKEAIAKAQRDVDSFATGTIGATGGISLVGENGPELRVLNSGDGIIPADITKNLLRIGSMGINPIGNSGDTYINKIDTVKLENVNDVDSLFSGLKNYAIQSANARA